MSYSSEVLADNPLVYLRLDETSGATCANSGSLGGNATAQGAFTRNITAAHTNLGVAIDLGGTTSDYITYPDIAALDIVGDVTYEAWVKVDNLAAAVLTIMSKGSDSASVGGYCFQILVFNGTIRLQRDSIATLLQSATSVYPADTNWRHIAFTRAGNLYTIYLNGTAVASGTATDSIQATSKALHVGVSPGYTGFFNAFDGKLDEVAVYNTALSGARIAAHYAAYNAAAATPPVADFTGTPLAGAPPLSVAFTDTSTNTPTSWAWTFGDGGTSTSQNPTHSYTSAGTYTVALVATNAGGSNTKTRTAYVTVAVPQPQGICVAFGDPWDNPNPTWTRIDNVAGRRVRGYTIDRGRPNEFEKTGTGTATIRIADTIGTFDPTDPAAISNVAPGRQACINLLNPTNGTWHTIFRGYVESWRYVLDQTRQYLEIELTLTDGFAILSRYELRPLVDGVLPGPPPYTSPPYATVAEADQQKKLAELAKGNVLYGETVAVTGAPTSGTVGDRILSVLGDAGWPYDLATNWIGFPAGTIPDIFSGNVRIGPKAYAPGTSALDALWDAADGEFPGLSNLFMARDGHVRFRGRQARFRPTVAQYGIVARTVGDPSAWATDASVAPVSELEFSNGEDNLYNSCTATPQGVGTGAAWRQLNPDPPSNDNVAGQLVQDTASIAAYGLRGLTFDNLQTIEGKATGNNSMVETKLFSTYYVQNYKDPHPRISRLMFKTRRPAAQNAGALWELLSNAEISDLLTVKTDHPGAGGFNADFYIEGIHYVVTPGPPEHAVVELSLDVSPRAHWTTNPFTGDP